MGKTIDEMIKAATIIEEELIGGDGTHAEIEGAVEKACPAWAEDDMKAALVLAAHVMHRSGDEGWEGSEDELLSMHLMRPLGGHPAVPRTGARAECRGAGARHPRPLHPLSGADGVSETALGRAPSGPAGVAHRHGAESGHGTAEHRSEQGWRRPNSENRRWAAGRLLLALPSRVAHQGSDESRCLDNFRREQSRPVSAIARPARRASPAPCMRQTRQPRTAGARHGRPVRFERAVHRGA